MAIALWIVEGLLGLLFVITGCFKFFQNKEKVIESGGTWAEDFGPGFIKAVAALEIVSGISIIIPRALGHGHYLTFIAASGIVLIMTGAIFTHLRRKEYPHAGINLVFLLMALFVGYAARPF